MIAENHFLKTESYLDTTLLSGPSKYIISFLFCFLYLLRVSSRNTCFKFFLPSPHRVKLKDGVTFLGARPCNPTLWMISQDARVEGHRVVTLHCRKKESGYAQRYVALEFPSKLRRLIWEVNYRDAMKRHFALTFTLKWKYTGIDFTISEPVKVGRCRSELRVARKSEQKRRY